MFREMADNLNRYKLRTRVVLVYILLSLFTTLVLGFLIYGILSDQVITKIGENSILSLKQSVYAYDTLYQQVENVMSQMFSDRDLQNFIFARSEDKVVIYRSSLVLSQIRGVYPFIQSVELYNNDADMYYNTLVPYYSEFLPFKNKSKDLFQQTSSQRLIIFPRSIDIHTDDNQTSYQVLSFVYHPLSLVSNQSIVIINLDLNYIRDNILSYSDSLPDGEIFMFNDDDTIILHNDSDMFLKNITDKNYRKFINSNSSEGYVVEKVDGTKALISYTKSSVGELYFFSIEPYSSIIGGLMKTRNIVLVSSAAIFLVALIISILLTRTIYNPFQRLLDKLGGVSSKSSDLELLNRSISKSLWYQSNYEVQSEELFLHELITGIKNSSINDETRNMMKDHFHSETYCVILFKFDNYSTLKQTNSPEAISLLRNNLISVIYEALSPICMCASTIISENEIAVLVATSKESQIQNSFSEIHEIAYSLFNVSLCSAQGSTVFLLDNVLMSYENACKLMYFRLFEGHGCHLSNNIVQPYLNNDASFPYDVETNLIKAVNNGEKAPANNWIDQFQNALYMTPYEHVIHYATQLAYSLIQCVDESLVTNEIFSYNIISEISESETIDNIIKKLRIFTLECSKVLSNKQENQKNERNCFLINEVKKYISDDYINSNLSIETAAKLVNLSAEYIRKLFKKVEGTSFSNYLNQYRLQKAKELLLHTDIPAIQIGEKVGLDNITYFFTLFKKEYKITPTEFRKVEKN